jgi:hypothetical protein
MIQDDENGFYVGVARAEGDMARPTLEEAIEDAYEKGKASGKTKFRVAEIIVTGSNPINEYKVFLQGI